MISPMINLLMMNLPHNFLPTIIQNGDKFAEDEFTDDDFTDDKYTK